MRKGCDGENISAVDYSGIGRSVVNRTSLDELNTLIGRGLFLFLVEVLHIRFLYFRSTHKRGEGFSFYSPCATGLMRIWVAISCLWKKQARALIGMCLFGGT